MKTVYNYQYRNKPICTIVLIALNVVIFFGLSFLGMTEDPGFLLNHGAMYVPYVLEQGEYYRLVTCIFLHFGFDHLMSNMIMLAVVGWNLEFEIGRIKFLIIYFISGLGGNLVSAWWDIHTDYFAVSAGASGAVFGIIGALLYIAIRNHGQLGNVSGRGLLFMAALSLYYGFTAGGVDNAAHIGGLLMGFVLSVLLYWKRKSKRSESSWS